MPLKPYIINPQRLSNLRTQYENFSVDSISYATVRDFSDGVTQMPELGTISKDLKDAQRPWMLKAIIGNVPVGGRLLEIGAGDPHVVHWLTSMGYEVVIVDPYDGSGHGPTDYDFYKKHFPSVKFIRENFADHLPGLPDASFDCIYSISVLEHIPHMALHKVMKGIRRYQKSGAITLHAVDHVHRGRGEPRHRETLKIIAEALLLSDTTVDSVLLDAHENPETYFLSAESHTMWRGAIPYDDFPMRRCISVQFAQKI